MFYMQISSVGRGSGRRATAAAAYRAGERLRDERTGTVHNFSRRRDVLHTEIFLPSQLEGSAAGWAHNRAQLWNAAEHAEKRANSRVAREFQVSLPPELAPEQRIALARAFSREVAERYRVAVDLAVHEPRADGDPRNFHAHLLATTREVTPTGLGARAGLDMSALERRRRELPDHRAEYFALRERWASLANEALQQANVDARIDHRSLAAQGSDREPRPSIPIMHLKMERRGIRSELAERLRAAYQDRVQRRLGHAAGAPESTPTQPGPAEARSAAVPVARSAPRPASRIKDLEEIRREAREAWLRLRPKEAERAAQLRSPAQSPPGGERVSEEHEAPPLPGEDLGL